jgi:hypothetical protein
MKNGKLRLFLTTSIALALGGCATTATLVNLAGTEAPLLTVATDSSVHDGNGPDRLVDGDLKTRWSASGDNSWAVLDYGQVSTFDAVRLAFHKGDERSSKFDIEVSEDGKTWTQVISGAQSSGTILTMQRFPFAPVNARYIKYIGHGNTKNMWNSLNEFNAVNCKVNTCLKSEFPPLVPVSVDSSTHDGNGPDRLIDGDLKTRWSASGDNSWAVLDYGTVTDFDAVRLAFHKGNERSSKFDIEVSEDGSKWTKVIADAQSSGSMLTMERFEFSAVKARFVKYVGHGNTKNMWNSLNEFNAVNCEINDCPKSENPLLMPTSVDSSTHDGNGPDRLIDGDLKTRWSASGDNSWAVLDYGQVAEFDAIRMAFHKGDERSSKFDIAISEDGEKWTNVITAGESSGKTLTIERFPIDLVKARFVKYIGHGNSKNMWNSLNEFNAVNCEINECPVTEIITEETLKMLAAAVPAVVMEKNDGMPTTLDNWKLTLPVTNTVMYGAKTAGEFADSAAEIVPGKCSLDGSSLSKETKNPYFKADDKGWHFRVPLEGGATTPNATYIRSELRELANNWKPCDETSLANWSYGGTHTLAATLQLNEIPDKPLKKDGKSSTAPKVVLGQIHAHDINAATVKLLWEGAKKPVRVILNKTTEKSAFSVKLGKIADVSKPWTYIIKMTDEGIELSAGGVTKKLKFGKELDDAWKNETFYFKAGLYPQVYKAGGGAFDATFTKISTSHLGKPGAFGTHVELKCDSAVATSDCSKATWWDVPLKSPVIPAKPLATNKPGQNIDLTTWYLSLPFDHDESGTPDNVDEWYLAQGYEHPELFYTADDGGLVFKSFIKGVRTSKNTKYVRTELREMLRRGDESIPLKGVTKNNWVFSSAPEADLKAAGAVDGVLNATLKIDHTTTTGELNQVGRFIIGQIHDKDDEPIRLYYRKLPDQKTGTVYFAHENTREGTDTYYDLVGGIGGVTKDGIALGEVFSYQIKVVGNMMTVTLMREGKPDAVQVVDMSESGYDVGGRYMYFKAGVYNQNNSGNPDDYVQATFYKIETSHDQYKK